MKILQLPLLFSLLLLTLPSFSANKIVYESFYNATFCHVNAKGAHKIGKGTTVVFYDKYFGKGTFTEPGKSYSKIPIIDEGDKMYAIVDNGDAADEWTVPYSPNDYFILSYDGKRTDCNSHLYHCVIFRSINPCR